MALKNAPQPQTRQERRRLSEGQGGLDNAGRILADMTSGRRFPPVSMSPLAFLAPSISKSTPAGIDSGVIANIHLQDFCFVHQYSKTRTCSARHLRELLTYVKEDSCRQPAAQHFTMTMTMDTHQRHHLSMGFDHMPYSAGPPSFSNPWASSSAAHSSSHLFPTSMATSGLSYDSLAKPQSSRTTMSMPYSSLPASAPPIGTGNFPNLPYSQSELLNSSHDLLGGSRSNYEQGYSGATSQATTAYASHPGTYAPVGSYGQSLVQQQQQQAQDNPRRLSQSNSLPLAQTSSAFGDALDGARGMVAMSQDMTPRNIYGPRIDRSSPDSYGFPTTHSAHSSISSGSTYPQYYTGSSAESSITDYSSASESMEPIQSRTLPRPSGLINATMPPAPQSMMGSFNSKVSSNTQKKHKCKVCDKRFTRPSSLQTHMYSHTGEKPFACEIQGCGRNFSVVSNLRRHRKVHKGDRLSDHGSPEDSWASER